jgi:hypothetical protein
LVAQPLVASSAAPTKTIGKYFMKSTSFLH